MKQHFNREALAQMTQFQLEWLLRCTMSELATHKKHADLQSQIALVKTALKQKCEP